MKNLLLSTVLVLGLGTIAMANNVSISEVPSIAIYQDKEYKEIKPSEVSADALKKIGEKYAGYTLTGAAVAADGVAAGATDAADAGADAAGADAEER